MALILEEGSPGLGKRGGDRPSAAMKKRNDVPVPVYTCTETELNTSAGLAEKRFLRHKNLMVRGQAVHIKSGGHIPGGRLVERTRDIVTSR